MGDRVAYFAHLAAIEDQVERVRLAMKSGRWWTKDALAAAVQGTPHSMSARFSDLRKLGYHIEKRQSEPGSRLYLYRMTQPTLDATTTGGASA